ncbi:hypothetical protein Bca4012_062694 [Brassica carinata]|uniref:RRM domain-containing protein n=1 Tax=Brassica carinata TaxID=52824 RepID=A0A8X7QGC6_BRACI|nr:hypothetical protein Bca52824_064232 [Brassica carinata]
MELASDLDAMRDRRSRSVRILVKGYDTSLHVDVVKSHSGYIYILGDGAEEKALQLSGSEMEGCKIVATSTHGEFLKLTPAMAARLAEAERTAASYDTSLPAADIEASLTNHFSSCGEIVTLQLYPRKYYPLTDHQAIISILGEGAREKALELNGSDMGGFKLVVACSEPMKNRPPDEFPRGYTVPARFTNPKKTSRYKMKKKKANQEHTNRVARLAKEVDTARNWMREKKRELETLAAKLECIEEA